MKQIKFTSIRSYNASILAIICLLAGSGLTSAQAQIYHLTDLGVLNEGSGQMISHPAATRHRFG